MFCICHRGKGMAPRRAKEAIPRFRLKEAMKAAGMTNVSELARASGVSRPTIHAMLNNSAGQVHLKTLGRLAVALKLENPGDLIGWS
jgi:transcriptional regulator with XRE-family HTH domain